MKIGKINGVSKKNQKFLEKVKAVDISWERDTLYSYYKVVRLAFEYGWEDYEFVVRGNNVDYNTVITLARKAFKGRRMDYGRPNV